MGSPELSFLLVNFNSAALVAHCLDKLLNVLPEGVPVEILIADNSSDPAYRLPADFAASRPSVRLVQLENRGWIDALNHLFPLAQGRYLVVMHTDLEFAEGAPQAMLNFLRAHPEVGIASPDLVYPDGSGCRIRLQFPTIRSEAGMLVNSIWRALLRRNLVRAEPEWDRSGDVEAEMVMSVCMFIRREIAEAILRIEPRLVFYYGNDYLCARARKLGYKIAYVSTARAVHYERFTPPHLYARGREMQYKSDTIGANPRMRDDFLVFLRSCYPWWRRIPIRCFAILHDSVMLLTQLRSFRSRREGARNMWRSLRVLMGNASAAPAPKTGLSADTGKR